MIKLCRTKLFGISKVLASQGDELLTNEKFKTELFTGLTFLYFLFSFNIFMSHGYKLIQFALPRPITEACKFSRVIVTGE